MAAICPIDTVTTAGANEAELTDFERRNWELWGLARIEVLSAFARGHFLWIASFGVTTSPAKGRVEGRVGIPNTVRDRFAGRWLKAQAG
jgi:hypothetical protein